MMQHRKLAAWFMFGMLACPISGLTAEYPEKPVDVVIPYSTGNGLDLLGREFSHRLEAELKVPLVVINREGAAGVIGTGSAARASPDGYTLLFHANPPFVTAALVPERAPYDPRSSFVPVAQVGSVPLVLVTSGKSPFNDFAGMRSYVQAHPEKANYASAGVGSPGHIYGELLNRAMDADIQEVRYKATGQALIDVVSGEVLLSLVSVSAVLPYLESGSLRALAVGSSDRLPRFPEVPTLAEVLHQPGFEAGVWYGFFAPAGTPATHVQKLYEAIARAAQTSELRGFMARLGMVPHVRDSAALAAIVDEDVKVAARLLQDTKLAGH
ncbi:Bug family tripartite tricarboxylate transporter substrate binding protein [Verticiella sediminum]|nr:tripartite tricarboxylate transporter substrate binding protein [Verticiella sediminum]